MSPKRERAPEAVEALPLVIVEWTDAARDLGFDGHPEDVRGGTVVNHTAGFLLRESRTELVLVTDVTVAERTVRWPYGIPKRLVRKVVSFGEWYGKFPPSPVRARKRPPKPPAGEPHVEAV